MINNFQAFIPSIPPFRALTMFVGRLDGPIAGTVLLANNETVEVPTRQINLGANAFNFIYVDLATGTIQLSVFGLTDPAAGFPADVYPIAVLRTDGRGVLDLADVRPDLMLSASGGGGSSVDTVAAFSWPQALSIIAGQNIFATCIAASNPLTLPTPATWMAGQQIKIIKTDDTGYVSINGAVQGISLSNQYQYVTFQTDGNNWYIISNN